jgi:hypothetical protein
MPVRVHESITAIGLTKELEQEETGGNRGNREVTSQSKFKTSDRVRTERWFA